MNKDCLEYAEKLKKTLVLRKYAVFIDSTGNKIDKKIRMAQMDCYNFIGVIGPEEMKENKITLRKHGEE